jgi:hypothetical protein
LGTESDRNRKRALKSQLFLDLSVVTRWVAPAPQLALALRQRASEKSSAPTGALIWFAFLASAAGSSLPREPRHIEHRDKLARLTLSAGWP